jgi:NAD/NADP transhydrogenase beta subunit
MNLKSFARFGALGGIFLVVLQLTGQMLIQVGGQEPAFNAGATEIVNFFAARDQQLASWGAYISLIALIPFLWFLGILWKRLRQYEQQPEWLSMIALVSGILIVAVQVVSGAGWTIAFARMEEQISPEFARFQFDFGNYLFAVSWVMTASMLIAAGILSISRNALPKWTGWLSLLTAATLLIAAAFWYSSSMLIFVPITLYWLWLIIVSVILFKNKEQEIK